MDARAHKERGDEGRLRHHRDIPFASFRCGEISRAFGEHGRFFGEPTSQRDQQPVRYSPPFPVLPRPTSLVPPFVPSRPLLVPPPFLNLNSHLSCPISLFLLIIF